MSPTSEQPRVSRATHFCGLVAWPVGPTLGPRIHNAAFRHLDLDWTYLPFEVPPERLREAIEGLRALGASGANVGAPFKEMVIGMLDDVSGDARAVGAVSAIQRVGDALIGHNSEVDGFREFLVADTGTSIEGKRALVLGSGGAARAVVKVLDDLGAADVVVAARRATRAEQLTLLAERGRASTARWEQAPRLASEVDVVVNATPIGSDGGEAGTPLSEAAFRPGQLVVDLVVTPPSTPLVEQARADGADAWGGLGVLVQEAAAAFRIWTGQEPPLETMSATAVHALGLSGVFRTSGSTSPPDVPKDV